MKNTYSDAIKSGILSKQLFLDSPVTKGFIDWLVPYIDGKKSLVKLKLEHNSFNEAITDYKWPLNSKGLDFNQTIDLFNKWHIDLKSTDQNELIETCKEIFKWGGILNIDRLERIQNLQFFLGHINNKLLQEKIIIYDLNPNYISSGFTKIYAALNEKFIMYDGRVGAAICYLIRKYLESTNTGNDLKTKLPDELIFGWSWGRGKIDTRKNRNPNIGSTFNAKFDEINERNRELHFISNIKANWLLEALANKVKLPACTLESKKVFAIQTALFMLGADIPK